LQNKQLSDQRRPKGNLLKMVA